MKKPDLGQSINTLANIGVIAGIIFLGYELRQNTVVTRLGVVHNFSDSLSAVDFFMAGNESFAPLIEKRVANPDLGRDGYGPGEWPRLLAFSRAQLRQWESAYTLFVASGLAEDMVPSLRRQILWVVSADPNVYRLWQSLRDSFGEPFNDLMEEIGKELALE